MFASPADINPCPGGEVGQMELPYLGPAHAGDVALARAVRLGHVGDSPASVKLILY